MGTAGKPLARRTAGVEEQTAAEVGRSLNERAAALTQITTREGHAAGAVKRAPWDSADAVRVGVPFAGNCEVGDLVGPGRRRRCCPPAARAE